MASSDPPIRAAIFDFGGVLTTPGRAAISAWTRAEGIRSETFSAALKDWLSRSAPPGTPVHRLETGNLPVAEFNRLLAARLRTADDQPVEPEGLINRIFAQMHSDPEMLELVRCLRDNGIRTAMLSNSWGGRYPWDQLDGLFEHAVISGEIGLRKPDSRIYQLTLDRLGLPPEETVFIDDASPNTEAAEQLGLHTVRHTDASSTKTRLAELLPELRLAFEGHR